MRVYTNSDLEPSRSEIDVYIKEGKEMGKVKKTAETKRCRFCEDPERYLIDYKDTVMLRLYLTDRGKIKPRQVTGLCNQHQHDLAVAVRQARDEGLLPYAVPVIPASRFAAQETEIKNSSAKHEASKAVSSPTLSEQARGVGAAVQTHQSHVAAEPQLGGEPR